MSIPRIYKVYIIIILSILVLGLLPGVAFVWAEASSGPTQIDHLIQPAQGGGLPIRTPVSPNNTIVQSGVEFSSASISTQSDGSGVEVVPAAAFINTNELGTGTGGNDWFFSLSTGGLGGFVTNDSGGNWVCLAAPIYLPPDVTMESFTVYIFDGSNSDVYVYFDRTEAWDLNYDEMAWVQSSGNVGAVRAFTSSSISDPVVKSGFNYHIAFCLPSNTDFNIGIFGAQVNYSVNTTQVYLPVIHKGEVLFTTLTIKNSTGNTINFYKILNKDTLATVVQCTNIPDTQEQACGAFESGYYHASVDYAGCGSGQTSNPIAFPPGNCVRTVTCNNVATMTCDGIVVTTNPAVLDGNQ